MGPFIERFEAAFAAYIGVGHAVAVSSGTAGLHLCMRAANIGPGDEVITSPFSFVASANCILYERATPIFVDIDERSMNIDPDLVEAAVTDPDSGQFFPCIFSDSRARWTHSPQFPANII